MLIIPQDGALYGQNVSGLALFEPVTPQTRVSIPLMCYPAVNRAIHNYFLRALTLCD